MLRAFRVLVLNAGAHRIPAEAYRRKMRQLGGLIRTLGSGVVFRTTVPGFCGCNETRSAPPLASVQEAEAYLEAHPFFDQHAFVPAFNRIAAAEVRRAGGRVLDVYPSSILRLDDRSGSRAQHQGGHAAAVMDCLHYRAPLLSSSLRSWARMLGESLAGRAHRS